VVSNSSGDQISIWDLQLPSAQWAAVAILVVHFVNQIHYSFIVNRIDFIAGKLPKNVLVAARSFPSFSTSNVMTESTVTLIYAVLSVLLIKESGINGWMVFLAGLAVNIPFMWAGARSIIRLNARQDGAN